MLNPVFRMRWHKAVVFTLGINGRRYPIKRPRPSPSVRTGFLPIVSEIRPVIQLATSPMSPVALMIAPIVRDSTPNLSVYRSAVNGIVLSYLSFMHARSSLTLFYRSLNGQISYGVKLSQINDFTRYGQIL
jgi:hypothetical protein